MRRHKPIAPGSVLISQGDIRTKISLVAFTCNSVAITVLSLMSACQTIPHTEQAFLQDVQRLALPSVLSNPNFVSEILSLKFRQQPFQAFNTKGTCATGFLFEPTETLTLSTSPSYLFLKRYLTAENYLRESGVDQAAIGYSLQKTWTCRKSLREKRVTLSTLDFIGLAPLCVTRRQIIRFFPSVVFYDEIPPGLRGVWTGKSFEGQVLKISFQFHTSSCLADLRISNLFET